MTDLSRLSFAEVADLAPKHTPSDCTRSGCRRCQPQEPPRAPKAKHNPHDTAKQHHREPCPFDPLVQPLRTVAVSMPDPLSKSMLSLAEAISVHGHERWQRLLAWEKHQLSVSLVREEPNLDEDEDGQPIRRQVSAQTEEERDDDRRAGRYAEDDEIEPDGYLVLAGKRPEPVTWLRFAETLDDDKTPPIAVTRNRTTAALELLGLDPAEVRALVVEHDYLRVYRWSDRTTHSAQTMPVLEEPA